MRAVGAHIGGTAALVAGRISAMCVKAQRASAALPRARQDRDTASAALTTSQRDLVEAQLNLAEAQRHEQVMRSAVHRHEREFAPLNEQLSALEALVARDGDGTARLVNYMHEVDAFMGRFSDVVEVAATKGAAAITARGGPDAPPMPPLTALQPPPRLQSLVAVPDRDGE